MFHGSRTTPDKVQLPEYRQASSNTSGASAITFSRFSIATRRLSGIIRRPRLSARLLFALHKVFVVSKTQNRRRRYGKQNAKNPEHVPENNGGDQDSDAGYAKRAREQ